MASNPDKGHWLRKLHLTMFCIWIILCVPGILFWRDSVFFVVACSLFANLYATMSAYQGSRTETLQRESNE